MQNQRAARLSSPFEKGGSRGIWPFPEGNANSIRKAIQAVSLARFAFFFLTVGLLASGSPGAQEVQFVDVTEQSGIAFVHVNGASGKYYAIETMCPGCGLFDCDGDGDLDLYLINGAPLPGFQTPVTPTNRLYRNDGGWRFVDVTVESGTGDTGYGMGCAVGDYDNDGDLDLYVTNFGCNVLYRNEGDGRFVDVTARAGVGDARWSSSAAFVDYDADGRLDLYLANYADFRLEDNRICSLPNTDIPGYCHPDVYPGTGDVLYRNEGDDAFRDVTREAGVYLPNGRGLGVLCMDFDSDGDVDIYVANDTMENYLFENGGDGTFSEVGLLSGAAFNEMGHTEAGMGVDGADVDGNGYPDIIIGHLASETNTLYMNNGDGTFTDMTAVLGIAAPSLVNVTFGQVFLDADNDGDADAFAANGHVVDNIGLVSDVYTYRQANKLYENVERGRFVDASARFGPAMQIRRASRGLAAGDIDNDGDVDLLVANVADRVDLLWNDGGNRNNWLMVKLVGGQGSGVGGQGSGESRQAWSNRDGIGARVTVVSGDLRQVKEVHSAASYQSAQDLRLHFGLGQRQRVDVVEVRWPSGRVERIPDVTPNRMLVVEEGAGWRETNLAQDAAQRGRRTDAENIRD